MAHHKAVGATRKAAVGNQGHLFAQTSPHNRAGRLEHLRHPRPPLGPFVADHHHMARLHFAAADGIIGLKFTVKHNCLPLKKLTFLARNLGHAAPLSQVAVEDLQVTGLFDRIGQRPDDGLVGGQVWGFREVFGQGLAGHRQGAAIEQAFLKEVFHHGRHPAYLMEVFHQVLAARLEVGQVGRAV